MVRIKESLLWTINHLLRIFDRELARKVNGRRELPPVVVPSFKLGWWSRQARDPGGAYRSQDLWESPQWPRRLVVHLQTLGTIEPVDPLVIDQPALSP